MLELKNLLKVPLKFHWSALILLGLMIMYIGIMGIPAYFILLISLLFHEYSHVWAAQKQGLEISHVMVHGFGAGAYIKEIDLEEYGVIFKISVAGPVGSLILTGIFSFLSLFFYSPILLFTIYINLMLGLFNLLPIFPSDGGRILYALLGKKFGSLKAVRYAVWTSWILCGIVIVVGLYYYQIWLAAVLVYLIYLGYREKRNTEALLNN